MRHLCITFLLFAVRGFPFGALPAEADAPWHSCALRSGSRKSAYAYLEGKRDVFNVGEGAAQRSAGAGPNPNKKVRLPDVRVCLPTASRRGGTARNE